MQLWTPSTGEEVAPLYWTELWLVVTNTQATPSQILAFIPQSQLLLNLPSTQPIIHNFASSKASLSQPQICLSPPSLTLPSRPTMYALLPPQKQPKKTHSSPPHVESSRAIAELDDPSMIWPYTDNYPIFSSSTRISITSLPPPWSSRTLPPTMSPSR